MLVVIVPLACRNGPTDRGYPGLPAVRSGLCWSARSEKLDPYKG